MNTGKPIVLVSLLSLIASSSAFAHHSPPPPPVDPCPAGQARVCSSGTLAPPSCVCRDKSYDLPFECTSDSGSFELLFESSAGEMTLQFGQGTPLIYLLTETNASVDPKYAVVSDCTDSEGFSQLDFEMDNVNHIVVINGLSYQYSGPH